MATVVRYLWVNPLTGDTQLPTAPGDILTAAVSYWEDAAFEARSKRPRALEARQEKERKVTLAAERVHRFRNARDQYATDFRKLDKLTLQLATDDLLKVMHGAKVGDE